MRAWPPTWEKSSRGVMTSKLLDTLFCISCVDPFLGKIYRVKIKMKNTKILRKRSWRRLLMSFAEDTQLSLKNIWSIAVVLNLNKTLTTNIAWACSKNAWRDTPLIPRSWTTPGNRIDSVKIRRPSRTVCSTSLERNQKLTLRQQHKILLYLVRVALQDPAQCKPELEPCRDSDMQVARQARWWVCNRPQRHTNFRSLLNNLYKTLKLREGQLTQNNNSTINVVQISKRQPNKCFPKKHERIENALNLFCK